MFEYAWAGIKKLFFDIRLDSLLFDASLLLFSYFFIYGFVSGGRRLIDILNPVSGFIMVMLMEILIPVYAVYLYKKQMEIRPGVQKFFDESWSGCIVSISIIFFIYLPAVMMLPFLGIFIGLKAGLFLSYSTGVPFVICGIIGALIGLYLSRLQLRTNDFVMLIGNLHEKSIKKVLDKLDTPVVKNILPFLIVPLVFMWLEILLEGAGQRSNVLFLIFWLTVSGYLPMRILIELEPPPTPLNITTGLVSIGYFLYANFTLS